MSEKRIEDFFIIASGQVLTEHLPNHWHALTDDRLEEWLTNHAWEPYEYWSAKQLWDRIVSLAYLLLEVHNEALESVLAPTKESDDDERDWFDEMSMESEDDDELFDSAWEEGAL